MYLPYSTQIFPKKILPSFDQRGDEGELVMTKLFNTTSTKLHRRSLRKNQTDYEKIIWKYLRKKQICDVRFLRQYSVGKYILDFFCPSKKLAIEIDGGQHNSNPKIKRDKTRSVFLHANGIRVLRFWNNDIKQNISGVLHEITYQVKHNPTNLPFVKGEEFSPLLTKEGTKGSWL